MKCSSGFLDHFIVESDAPLTVSLRRLTGAAENWGWELETAILQPYSYALVYRMPDDSPFSLSGLSFRLNCRGLGLYDVFVWGPGGYSLSYESQSDGVIADSLKDILAGCPFDPDTLQAAEERLREENAANRARRA